MFFEFFMFFREKTCFNRPLRKVNCKSNFFEKVHYRVTEATKSWIFHENSWFWSALGSQDRVFSFFHFFILGVVELPRSCTFMKIFYGMHTSLVNMYQRSGVFLNMLVSMCFNFRANPTNRSSPVLSTAMARPPPPVTTPGKRQGIIMFNNVPGGATVETISVAGSAPHS